jgi:hypothetical protein
VRARARLLSAATGVCVALAAWAATADAAGRVTRRHLYGVHAGRAVLAAVVARARPGSGAPGAAFR